MNVQMHFTGEEPPCSLAKQQYVLKFFFSVLLTLTYIAHLNVEVLTSHLPFPFFCL